MNEYEERLFPTPTGQAWKKIGVKHHHGINIPLASIHTAQSCGIGEYLDVLPLIDWCAELGFDVIQLLPLNDSGPDPSPYNAQSMRALHPIYISLHALPGAPPLDEFEPFTKTKHVDYTAVQDKKLAYLRRYFDTVKGTIDYGDFFKKHEWIRPYALYKVLKDEFKGKAWMHWPEAIKQADPSMMHTLEQSYKEQIDFYAFLQYLCIQQLLQVRAYAEAVGVFIKGDIPILISPDSVEVWLHGELFDLNYAAGSPPDEFTEEGQYWGFPVYKWDAIKKENYAIWKHRLELASLFYHIYRIDHIIGFFRLWMIPRDKPASTGHFEPAEKKAMLAQGRELLTTLVHESSMLPIGENLGVMPPELNQTLEELGICGIKVFRWEHIYKGDLHYIPYEDYSPINMSSVSTHDSETLELWWRHYPEEAKRYCAYKNWTYSPTLTYDQRFQTLRDNHHNPTLFHINLLQEYLPLVPELTWDDPEDERINVPGTVLPTNWTYRYKKPLEELLANDELKKAVRAILKPL